MVFHSEFSIKLKAVALFTAGLLALPAPGFSQVLAPLSAPSSKRISPENFSSKIQVPQDLGSIEAEFHGRDKTPLILFLQDAHSVVDAQVHIQRLIDYFQKQYGVDLVLLEGGEGKLDPTLYRTFPDEKIKKQILDGYLERGELTGAQMAAIFGEPESSF